MKKLTILAFIATLFMLGCEKIDSNPPIENSLNDAKAAFQKQVTSGREISKSIPIATEKFNIIWDRQIQLSDSVFLYPIEIAEPLYMRLDGKNSILMNKRIHLMATLSDGWHFTVNSLLPNRFSIPTAFSGVMVSSDYFTGNTSHTNYYKGFPLAKNQDMEGKQRFNLLSGTAVNCRTVHAYVNGVYNTSKTYCDYTGSPGGGGGTNEPGEWQVPLPEDAHNQGTGYTTTDEITNNIQQECLKNMVNNLIQNDITFNGNESLQSIFGLEGRYDLVFTQSSNLSNDVHGVAISKGTRVDGVLQRLTVEVQLNLNTLTGASQEYIAMVILHESTHAYLYSKGFENSSTAGFHHEQMWVNYTDFIANYLTNTYNTPAADAYAMATEGLQETFGSRISESIYHAITNRKNDPSKDRAKEAAEYRKGNKGTSCNNTP